VLDAAIGKLAFGNFKLIQLWHGTGFKNIGLRTDTYSRKDIIVKRNEYNKYEFIIASSEKDKKFYEDCFEIENVEITGLPRNDRLLYNDNNGYINDDINVNEYKKVILYAPTFRDKHSIIPFSDSFYIKLQSWLVKMNYVFLIKKHPADDKLSIPNSYKSIIDITNTSGDIQEILPLTDILISDYSSIVVDYLLLDKPIIFYTYDFDYYISKNRSFYYDLKEILPGPFIFNSSDLLTQLKNEKWFQDHHYRLKYKRFKNEFHKYTDFNSTSRVCKLINDLIK
jgi:CDP-ribitol ribitolphosphotransferase / teichoic acid ribitol-phosphate polymerase